jgi:hypothetical protein
MTELQPMEVEVVNGRRQTRLKKMEVEVTIDHFYVFDNVAVFPVKSAIDHFPKFQQKIYSSGYDISHNHRIISLIYKLEQLIILRLKTSLWQLKQDYWML